MFGPPGAIIGRPFPTPITLRQTNGRRASGFLSAEASSLFAHPWCLWELSAFLGVDHPVSRPPPFTLRTAISHLFWLPRFSSLRAVCLLGCFYFAFGLRKRLALSAQQLAMLVEKYIANGAQNGRRRIHTLAGCSKDLKKWLNECARLCHISQRGSYARSNQLSAKENCVNFPQGRI